MPETTDIQAVLLAGADDIGQLARLRQAQAESPEQRRHLESLVIELMENPTVDGQPLAEEDAAFRIAAGLWALGRLEEAIAHLASVTSPEADYVLGRCYLDTAFNGRAAEAFHRAERGKVAVKYLAQLGHIEATAKDGEAIAALAALNDLADGHEDDPAIHFLRGLCCDLTGEYDEAIAAYEKALELDPAYNPAAFRLGFCLARRGNLDRALEHYAAITGGSTTYFNALINLGVLYEDRRQHDKAILCYRRVLQHDPRHKRARMFLRDAHASMDMVYDEDRARELERMGKLLSVPVTDFELSVRVRNCLQRMNIVSVGDLVHHTEEELLTSKNFGDTSLQEIKEMLAARGLRLGMGREEPAEQPLVGAPLPTVPMGAPDEESYSTSINELDLSLRSRKCMERLGIVTLGQLCERSADDLLSSRNFGRTSLAEVSEKLTRYGMALREPPPEETDEEGEDELDDEQDLTGDDV
ncbi:DNA-directed RNA polymerase subunit alpha C-terminal domain-containing protein [Planctomycetota bacterium]